MKTRQQLLAMMTGFKRLYDGGNYPPPTVEIVADGENLALMTYSEDSIESVWYYNLNTKNVQLTYKSEASNEVTIESP